MLPQDEGDVEPQISFHATPGEVTGEKSTSRQPFQHHSLTDEVDHELVERSRVVFDGTTVHIRLPPRAEHHRNLKLNPERQAKIWAFLPTKVELHFCDFRLVRSPKARA